jgi:hypothetical protein
VRNTHSGQPSRPEIIGVVLLGIGLLGIALSLRGSQPGALEVPGAVWPAAAAALYLVVALAVHGLRLRALALFAGACVIHAAYAFLMGCAFAVLKGGAPELSARPLLDALVGYPPAVLLQAAFALPLALVLMAPAAHAAIPCEALDRAGTAEEVLQGLLALEAAAGADMDPTLARVAAKARQVLLEGPARLRTTQGVTAPGGDQARADRGGNGGANGNGGGASAEADEATE